MAKNNKTRFFCVLYSDKTRVFDQSERAYYSIYIINGFIFAFSELANHSRESMQRPRPFYWLFSTLFSKWCHDFKQRRRHFSKIFRFFYQSRLFRFFILAGYFTSETIKELSDGNITTFFIQKQGTNETQHIYFGGRQNNIRELKNHDDVSFDDDRK